MSERHGLILQNMIGPLLADDKIEEALACAEGATRLAPDRPEPWIAKSVVLTRIPYLEQEVYECCQRVVGLDPNDPIGLHNLARAQMRLYQWNEALATINKAHHQDPSNPYHLKFAASLVSMLGDLATARKLHTGALDLFIASDRNDGSFEARRFLQESYVARAMLHAQLNDWPAYFADLAKRYEVCPFSGWLQDRRNGKGNIWTADQPVPDDFVIALEHGVGDQIQYFRNVLSFVHASKSRRTRAFPVNCAPSLIDLFNEVSDLDALAGQDGEIPLGHLPAIGPDQLELWNFQRGEFPLGRFTGPYLHSKMDFAKSKRERKFGLRIAFCWQGNPKHHFDWARSIPVQAMADWLEEPYRGQQRELISIQYGAAGASIKPPFEILPAYVQNAADDIDTMAKLADFIATCDVVIGPDTSALHLAGAMGKPAVMLHCYAQDWRWTLEEPLYGPSLRHIRQPKPGDWAGCFAQLDNEIHLALQASHTAVEALEINV